MSSDKFLIHTKQSLSTGVSYTDAEVSFIKVKKEKKCSNSKEEETS